jgi:hypothetical protein
MLVYRRPAGPWLQDAIAGKPVASHQSRRRAAFVANAELDSLR